MPPFRQYRRPLQEQRRASAVRNNALRKYIRRRRIAKQLSVQRTLRPKFGVLARKISKYAY